MSAGLFKQFRTPLRINLEPLAQAFVSLNVPHVGDPFQASTSSNGALKAACLKLQTKLKVLFDVDRSDLKLISVRSRDQQKFLRSWGVMVNAKRPALLIVSSDGDSFHLRKQDFNQLKERATSTANKLGLNLITSRFFYETDSPDSGKIYQAQDLGNDAQSIVKVSFALCPEEACFLSRSRATQIVKQMYQKLFGDVSTRQENLNLLLDLRTELEKANISRIPA